MKPFMVYQDGTPVPAEFDKPVPEVDLEQPSLADLCKAAFDEACKSSTHPKR